MEKKKALNTAIWIMIFGIIVVNSFLLYKVRQGAIKPVPMDYLDLKKPAVVVLLAEFECSNCVANLMFLNEMYERYKNTFEFTGIILSKTKTDRKGIAKAFAFPIIITNDFDILRRLNLNQTPVILGVSKEKRIYYSDLIPVGNSLSEDYIKKGVLDRLYYSLSQE